jgi:hypothetical protein
MCVGEGNERKGSIAAAAAAASIQLAGQSSNKPSKEAQTIFHVRIGAGWWGVVSNTHTTMHFPWMIDSWGDSVTLQAWNHRAGGAKKKMLRRPLLFLSSCTLILIHCLHRIQIYCSSDPTLHIHFIPLAGYYDICGVFWETDTAHLPFHRSITCYGS